MRALWIPALLLVAGCEVFGPAGDLRTEPVLPVHRAIADARERWEAYGLTDYTIVQTRLCECAPPYEAEVVVRGGQVVELRHTKPEVDDADHALAWFLTVDAAFDLIERELARGPARFEVTYHPDYGYPTNVFIDPDARMADEEIIRTFSNLARIVE